MNGCGWVWTSLAPVGKLRRALMIIIACHLIGREIEPDAPTL